MARWVILLVSVLLLPSGGAAAESETIGWRIEVRKEERRLRLWRDGVLEATYPVGLGFSPRGDKIREGDGATPEGSYRVCVKNPQSRYHLSLGIDYPNPDDARQALEEERISAEQEAAIRRAHRQGICPPWNTDLGGEIFLHGRGAGADWTLGCVALEDEHIEVLFRQVPIGTPVDIVP